jgi:hypothetical protein
MQDAPDEDDLGDLAPGDNGADDQVEKPRGAPRRLSSSRAWLALITEAERVYDDYQMRCDRIDRLYANLSQLAEMNRDREFQLFWANIGVVAPSIYSRPPVPVVVPRFKDRKPLPRMASELLERSTAVGLDVDGIDDVMRLIRDDLAINGRGVPWVRYEAEGRAGSFREKVCVEHTDRRDFVHDPARKWKDVDWVAKRSWLTKKQMGKRFKPSSGLAYLDCSYSKRKDEKDADDGRLKAAVWELWSKSQRKVVWVSEGCPTVLDEDKPHLDLEGFFPCPRPAYATVQRRTLIPVPDVMFYKDQLEEINQATARIAALADALRVRGFYPAGAGDIGDAIEAAIKAVDDNQILVPISNWAAFGNGAAKDTIVWLPLDQVASTITQLVALRKELIQDVYQITGLSDIMRGQTEASETLGAQQLKSQYGSVRIRDRQDEMVRMARDIVRISAEIMAENFQPRTLLEMSQLEIPTDAAIAAQIKPLQLQAAKIQQELAAAARDPEIAQLAQQNPEQAQQVIGAAQAQLQQIQQQIGKLGEVPTIEKVMRLLREQKLRPFVLDIETDSTIAPDENAQKQRATEFVTAVGGVMKQAVEIMQVAPEAGPVVAEVLKFTASQFRAGRQMEQVIDEFADKVAAIASQPKPPDPRQAEAAAKAEEQKAKQQQDAEDAKAKNAERMAAAQRMAAEAEAKQLAARTEAADAESARRIAEQQEADAAAARRIEREGKIATTDKQLQLLDAQRAAAIEKGALEVRLLEQRISQSAAQAEAALRGQAMKEAHLKKGDEAGE